MLVFKGLELSSSFCWLKFQSSLFKSGKKKLLSWDCFQDKRKRLKWSMHTNPNPVCCSNIPPSGRKTILILLTRRLPGADEIGRKEAGKQEKNNKRFWRCRLLHFFEKLENTTWLRLRKCARMRRDRIGDLMMVKSHKIKYLSRETFVVLVYNWPFYNKKSLAHTLKKSIIVPQ